jgi:low temperature requirement protein LtrA
VSDIEMEEKSATTLELFFDLVFVFAITQVVGFIVDDPTWPGLLRAATLLGILWWGWTNWAWTTNLVSLEPRFRRILVLVAMVGLFVMAHAVPTSFSGSALWLAVPYVIVTLLSSVLALLNARATDTNLEGLAVYVPVVLLGGGLLIAGAILESAQQWLWLASFAVNVIGAALSAGAVPAVDAKHFAERHGLILIIALGEAIIVVGVTLAGEPPSWQLAGHLAIGLTFAIALYWAYFDRATQAWEHGLRQAPAGSAGRYARDVYSFTHFPMIVGVVFSAVALEEAFAHPEEPFKPFIAGVFVIGVASYLTGIAIAAFRSARFLLPERMMAVAAIATVVLGTGNLAARTTVIVTTLILISALLTEQLRFRRMTPAEQPGVELSNGKQSQAINTAPKA